MTGEMLSQEEINALLGGLDVESDPKPLVSAPLTSEEIDALGEIGNISMGTAATTLFALLNNHKVMITTPRVETLSYEQLRDQITDDMVAVTVGYTEGLSGMNLMMLKEKDVKVIADLMMGGTGQVTDEPISELHLSAIAEAMNQMIGSSSTSMSQMFDKKIDISPPEALTLGKSKEKLSMLLDKVEPVVKVSFKIEIFENIIDSELMQILPLSFAKELVGNLLSPQIYEPVQSQIVAEPVVTPVKQEQPVPQPYQQPGGGQGMMEQPAINNYGYEVPQPQPQMTQAAPVQQPQYFQRDVEVQRPTFPSFDSPGGSYPKDNMDLLMDVALEVSVELGRTHKKIKEILEYGPGSVIELDRLVGEPIDVLVNGKFIAKGEVVVIDESFGIRITDIINRENRI
ncbi:MAG: flagellar motor switch phosphatase FliY [Cellulosilyticaceae bacterium]